MKCIHCGTSVEREDSYCGGCGAALTASLSNENPHPDGNLSAYRLKTIGVTSVISLLFALLLNFMLYENGVVSQWVESVDDWLILVAGQALLIGIIVGLYLKHLASGFYRLNLIDIFLFSFTALITLIFVDVCMVNLYQEQIDDQYITESIYAYGLASLLIGCLTCLIPAFASKAGNEM